MGRGMQNPVCARRHENKRKMLTADMKLYTPTLIEAHKIIVMQIGEFDCLCYIKCIISFGWLLWVLHMKSFTNNILTNHNIKNKQMMCDPHTLFSTELDPRSNWAVYQGHFVILWVLWKHFAVTIILKLNQCQI